MKKLFKSLFLAVMISTLFVGNIFAETIIPSGELDGLRGDVVAYKSELDYKSIDIAYNKKRPEDVDEDSEVGTVIVKLIKKDGSEDTLEEIPVYNNQESVDGEEVRVDIGSAEGGGRLYAGPDGLEIITSKRNEISEILKSKKVEQNDWKRFFGEMKCRENHYR